MLQQMMSSQNPLEGERIKIPQKLRKSPSSLLKGYGNMAALEAVWDDIQKQNVDKVYCLGDLVGYGPFPNEVIKFVQQK